MKILAMGNVPLERILGSGKTRLMWSAGLREMGHEVDTLEPKDFEMGYPRVKGRKFRQALGARLALAKSDWQKYDLVEFYGDEFWLATRWLAAQENRPFLVAHTDGLELLAFEAPKDPDEAPPTLQQKAYRFFARNTHERFSEIAFRNADGFVTGCELDRQFVLKHNIFKPEKTAVVPPGIDQEFLDVNQDRERLPRVAFVGSWIGRKGVRYLVEAMTAVLRERVDVEFHVFGTGERRTQVPLEFPEDLRGRIVTYGRVSNAEMAEQLALAQVYVFPSQYEGFGMALAEAMACGCAVVTSPTGLGGDLEDGVNGKVCPFGDVTRIRESVLQLLNNDDLRKQIAAKGLEKARSIRWETSVRMLEETYVKWVGSFRS